MDKIGVSHPGAMWRQGLGELRNALYPESNIAAHTEQGIYGTLSAGEVADIRREASEEPQVSVMDEWARRQEPCRSRAARAGS